MFFGAPEGKTERSGTISYWDSGLRNGRQRLPVLPQKRVLGMPGPGRPPRDAGAGAAT